MPPVTSESPRTQRGHVDQNLPLWVSLVSFALSVIALSLLARQTETQSPAFDPLQSSGVSEAHSCSCTGTTTPPDYTKLLYELQSLYGLDVYASPRIGGKSAVFHGDIEVHGKVIEREVETKINTVVAAEENQTVFSVNDIEDQVSVKDAYSMDLNIGTCLHPLRSDLAMTARCINCSLEKFNNERIECCIHSNLINCSNWEYNTAFHTTLPHNLKHLQSCGSSECFKEIRNSPQHYFSRILPRLTGSSVHLSQCSTGNYARYSYDQSDPNLKTVSFTKNKKDATAISILFYENKDVSVLLNRGGLTFQIRDPKDDFYMDWNWEMRRYYTHSDKTHVEFEVSGTGLEADTFVIEGEQGCFVVTPITRQSSPPRTASFTEPDSCMDLLSQTITPDDLFSSRIHSCCNTLFSYNRTITPCLE